MKTHTRLERPRLTGRLTTALSRGGVLLLAAAGYGKTTALEQALEDFDGDVAWVSCGAHSAEPGRLLLQVIQALGRTIPGVADELAERLEDEVSPLLAGVADHQLASDLEALVVEPLVIVLDDAEALQGAEDALTFLGELLRSRNSALRIAIATRVPLALPLAKPLAQGSFHRFEEADLVFTALECEQVLALQLGRDPRPEEVERILNATEGWPLGVALMAVGDRFRGEGDLPPGGTAAAFAFLAEEVFERLDEQTQAGAIAASVLEEMTPDTLGALGLDAELPKRFEELGLFVRPLDPGGERYAFHSLFRDFLSERRAELPENRRRALHASVAPVFARTGMITEAIDHWLDAAEWELAAAAIGEEASSIASASPGALDRWLGLLPARLRGAPELRLVEARLALGRGWYARAAEQLERAVEGFAAAGDPTMEWQARRLLVDALRATGDFERGVEVADGFEGTAARAAVGAPGAGIFAASCLAYLGHNHDASVLLDQAMGHPTARVWFPVAEVIRGAQIDLPAGRVERALKRVDWAIQHLERSDPFGRLTHAYAVRGLILGELGEYEEAMELGSVALEAAKRGGLGNWVEPLVHVYRATGLALLGRLDAAEAELERAGEDESWRIAESHLAEALIAAGRGDSSQSAEAAERAVDAAQHVATHYRARMVALAAPVLAGAGRPGRARECVQAELDVGLPPFSRTRLLAVRAWLGQATGDPEAVADLAEAWESAGDSIRHLVRGHWDVMSPLISTGLAEGALDPAEAMRAIEDAWPGGEALLRFLEHPVAEVRRAAAGPAAASGHPNAAEALAELESDPDRAVARAAAAAQERVRLSPPALAYSTLGGFKVRRGSWIATEDAWQRPAASRLVRFLLVHGEAVTEDAIFEALWPGKTADSARRSLQVALSRARGVLDGPWRTRSVIEASERTYRLRFDGGDGTDFGRFEAALDAALAESGPRRRRLLMRADNAWTGEPLPENAYDDWAVAWRERLIDRRAHMLAELAKAHDSAGDQLAAIAAARELVNLDPTSELAHRELMLAYARSGRRGRALRQYLECRSVLVGELGVEPGDETVLLQQRILAGDAV